MESAPKKRRGPRPGAKYQQRAGPILIDLRHAYRYAHDPGLRGTPQQEHFKKMFRDKPAEFISLLTRMEAQDREQRAAAGPAPAAGVDPAAERVGQLVDRWLQECSGAAPPGTSSPGPAASK